MRLYIEHLPLMMDLGVVLKLRPCFGMFYAVFGTAVIQMFHDNTVQTRLLQLRSDCDQEQIQSIILHQ